MPIHDWTRVTAGTFHAFHLAWIAELQRALNAGLLPEGYYALAEQVAGHTIPDVLPLQQLGGADPQRLADPEPNGNAAAVAVAQVPPRVSVTATASEAMLLAARRRQLVIRHLTGDRVVALVEILSPGNKQSQSMLDAFVEKAVAAIDQGYHLLIIDLFAPSRFDPRGIHGAIWSCIEGPGYAPPPEQPLTLAAYACGAAVTAYVERLAVGAELPEMPLFLDPGHYVNVPLAGTYQAAWEGLPQRWRRVIEAPAS
ncbi:MAG: DUF4058 family protein [Pirellulales bacterium]